MAWSRVIGVGAVVEGAACAAGRAAASSDSSRGRANRGRTRRIGDHFNKKEKGRLRQQGQQARILAE